VPYYVGTNPALSELGQRVLREILAELMVDGRAV
jgi:hypothetical protein